MTQLGRQLKVLRNERGLTQEQVARRAEIALLTYVRIEKGHTPGRPGRGASTNTLEKIARAFDVPISALFDFEAEAGEADDAPAASTCAQDRNL